MKEKLRYFVKCFNMLNQLSVNENICRLWLYFDYFSSLLVHGCLIRQYIIGEFWKYSYQERRKCMTYRRICKLFTQCNKPNYIHILNSKRDFNNYFSDFVYRDWLYMKECTFQQFLSFLSRHSQFIIKPQDGVEGNGIRKCVYNGVEKEAKRLFDELTGKNFLIEEIIIQHPRMIFGNSSVNTIRMHTILDKEEKAHPFKAILRAGIGDSVVDNYCHGGMIYEVDLKTGIVCTCGQGKYSQKSFVHPKTNIMMLGYQIPLWEKVLETSKKAAEKLPQIRIIGWDIAITSKGIELIEGNHNPDYELLEFIGSKGYYTELKKYI